MIKIILLKMFFLYAILDCVWLGLIMPAFYKKWIGDMMRIDFRLNHVGATLAVWFLIVSGLWIFVRPIVLHKSSTDVFCMGALFGAIVYGVYELTNYVGLRTWPVEMVIVDFFWGASVCGVTALFMHNNS